VADLLTPAHIPGGDVPNTGTLASPIDASEAQSVLRWLREGAYDETIKLELPTSIRTTVSPLIGALRWGAVLYGMVFAIDKAINSGNLWVVTSLAIVLFLTVWRTFRPLRLAWHGTIDRLLPVTDGAIIGIAVGLSGGFGSSFIFCLIIAVVVGAFGWGPLMGATVMVTAFITMAIAGSGLVSGEGFNLDSQGSLGLLFATLIIVALISFARSRLLDAERRRAALTGRLNVLAETNDLLHILNQMARNLNTSFDLRQVLATTQRQIVTEFDANVIAVFTRDDATESWLPQMTEGCTFGSSIATSLLPYPVGQALMTGETVMASVLSGEGLAPASGSGLYTSLRTRGKIVGLLGIENPNREQYGQRDMRLIEGLSEALALAIDTARSFGRLRSLATEEERTRIARDLHDRLGQYLTFISFELERIVGQGGPRNPALEALHTDVKGAIDELRETLRQLRTGVSPEEPLALVADQTLRRFTERTGILTEFRSSGQRSLEIPVENEMLRILQEALNNAAKHSQATNIMVTWNVDDDGGTLTIQDNGRGFDTSAKTREDSFGLAGMRERADVIEANIAIDSAPNRGTTITVRSAPPTKEIVLL